MSQHDKKVHWGNVCVHTHVFKLGCNPGMLLKGPPLTIDWSAEKTEDFPTVEAFYDQYHSGKTEGSPVYRITSMKRREIASEGSPNDDIEEVERDVHMIQDSRAESVNDPPEGSIKDMLHKKSQEKSAKKETKKPRLFGSIFRPLRR